MTEPEKFRPWPAFFAVIDKHPLPGRGAGFWANVFHLLSLVAHSVTVLLIGLAFLLWDLIAPLIRFSLVAGAIVFGLDFFGVIDAGRYLQAWRGLPPHRDLPAAALPPAIDRSAGPDVWPLVLAALAGAGITLFGVLIWLKARRSGSERNRQR